MGPEHIRVVQDYGFYGSNFWLAGAVTSYYAVTIKSVSWSQVSTTHVVHPVYPVFASGPTFFSVRYTSHGGAGSFT